MRNIYLTVAILLIAIGLYVSYEFFNILSNTFTYGFGREIKMTETGQVGDFIGGVVGTIFSLAGTILLLLTLNQQSISNFEGKFFKLIELHKANVDEILLERATKNDSDKSRIEGRRAFKHVFDDIISCRNEIKVLFEKSNIDNIYTKKYRDAIEQHLKNIHRTIELKELALLNISYCIVFYGVGEEGEQILGSLFNGKFNEVFIKQLMRLLKMKPVYSSIHWNKWQELLKIEEMSYRLSKIDEIVERRKLKLDMKIFDTNDLFYSNDFVKYYGGNQFWLGHYYRHLFQSIKFVNKQNILSFEEKYFYIKTFRAQLSTYEQALLLINSLSLLGMIWELTPEYKKSAFPYLNNLRRSKSLLITRYNLIKNLPGEQMSGINYKQFYPNVEYEIDRLMKI